MTDAGWTRNDHAINLYTYVLGYHPDQEALEAGDDKDYNAIKRALEHSYHQGRVEGLRQAGEAYIKYLMNPEYRKSWKTFDEWCRWMAQQAQEGGGGE